MTKSSDISKASEQGAEEASIEAAITDSASSDAAAATKKAKPEKSHGSRNFILMVLLIVVAVLGSLALSGKLKPLYESASAMLEHVSLPQQEQPETTVIATSPVVAKALVPMKNELSEQTVKATQSQPKPLVSSEDVHLLLSSMEVLHEQLQQMSRAQQSLQNALQEQQQMNLQVRLRWIADPASRLPQLQLTWEEISLLPALSDDQRSEAVRMHALAIARVQQLKQWQDALNKWADALMTPVQRNILPQPEQPWLAWIVSQFQLRQAPSSEARHLADLRARLLDVARHLTLESWPDKGAWQSLQAELLLQIKAMRLGGGVHNAEAIETGLPESFDAIQADINTLRQTALQWQQEEAR